MKEILAQIKQYKKDSILTPVFTALEVFMEMLLPFIMAKIIDDGIEKGNMTNVYIFGGVMVAAAMVSLLSGFLAGKYAASASAVEPFDMVFIDPPYAFETNDCNQLLADLASRELTSSNTVIMLERSTRSEAPTAPANWEITDRRDYGETAVYYIEPSEPISDNGQQ